MFSMFGIVTDTVRAAGLGDKQSNKPICPTGPEQGKMRASGPPHIAPTRDCFSPSELVQDFRRPARDGELPPLGHSSTSWHHFLGALTGPAVISGGPETQGVWGSIRVQDIILPSGEDRHFVASFFIRDQGFPVQIGNGMELGWIECTYNSKCLNKQALFVADSVDTDWTMSTAHVFSQYTLVPGTEYQFAITYEGSNIWRAWIWIAGAWNPLIDHQMPFTNARYTRENFETWDVNGNDNWTGRIPQAVTFGWMHEVFIRIGLGWQYWSTSYPTMEASFPPQGCTVSWFPKWYTWSGYC